MNTATAQRAILVSALFTFAFGFIHSLTPAEVKKHGDFPSTWQARLFVGTGVTFIGLSALSEFAPGVAGPFAILIGTTATVTTGAPVLNYVLGLVSDPKDQPHKPAARSNTHPDVYNLQPLQPLGAME